MQIETQTDSRHLLGSEQTKLTEVGIAIDVGTATVALNVWSLSSGKLLGSLAERNSQMRYGQDAIHRITFAVRPPLTGSASVVETGSSALHYSIIAQLEKMIAQTLAVITQKFAGRLYFDVSRIVITGNTTMLSFICAFPVEGLAAAPFTPPSKFGFTSRWNCVRRGLVSEKCASLDSPTPEILQIFASSCVDPSVPVFFPPCPGAFVGADTVCAMLSAGFLPEGTDERQNENSGWNLPLKTPVLLADIGANTEIALFVPGSQSENAKIMCASSAAGPVFECTNVICGMSPLNGAIEKVTCKDKISCQVIGGGSARGVCGTGLVSAGAEFIRRNIIDDAGIIQKNVSKLADGTTCVQLTPAVFLSQPDIRSLLLAKAAVYAGLEYMLEHSPSLPVLCVAGSSGADFNIEDACTIGLIPQKLKDRCVHLGDAALEGASAMLFSKKLRKRAFEIANHTEIVNFSELQGFQEKYSNFMKF